MRSLRTLLMIGTVSSLAFAAACGGGGGGGGGGSDLEVDNGFESDDPSGQTAASRSAAGFGAEDSATNGNAAPTSADGAGDGKSADRTVEEADIIKVEGNRLYALSRYGGLAVIDITDPDHMKVLGRKRVDGMPFEMYVENGRAFVMLNDFGRWIQDSGDPYGRWVQMSEIVALDVTNPAAIGEVSHFDVPGVIADSRLVGDAAYVVTYEDGYCWGCQTKPATIVTSFNVGTQITKSDQLVYTSSKQNYSSWKRSVSATNQRLYIAGPEWSWEPGTANGSSVIQVIDISDPTGKLKKGADVPVAGQINSRWQMDEFDGVLRVVAQFGNGWGGSGLNPKVQTFTVTNATSVKSLGSTELVLPSPESLRSVRFDGTRAYAITAQQTDPLYTIDLSNPAAPKQAAALTMPGWIFHMEPRGDRLVGFGHDSTAWNSNLAVSLFDVSDLSNPKMLKRVSFGGAGAQLAEDQDRIQKSVRILDSDGLILVPFASYGRWLDNNTCEAPKSGIQLIDYGHDDLTLRGLAPQWGMPRRAFVANGRLLAMSDRNVTSFDIGSRDAPAKTSELDLSNPAYRLAELPNHIASVTSDWWSGEAMLSLTPKAHADDADVIGKVSLASLAPQTAASCSSPNGWTSWYDARIFGDGNTVYLSVPYYSYDQNKRGGKLIAAAIDVSNPLKPTIIGKTETPFVERDTSNGWYGWYGTGCFDGYAFYSYYGGLNGSLVGAGEAVVRSGTKLAYIEVDYEPIQIPALMPGGYPRWTSKVHRRIHVVDFATPNAPIAHEPIDLPDSLGSSPLQVYKGTVVTSRWVQSVLNPDKVRFFVDRVDLNGSVPVKLASINTPGSLLLADEASSRFVTSDYHATRTSANDYVDCQQKLGWRGYFDYDTKKCIAITRDFKLTDVAETKVTLRQTLNLPSQNIAGVQVADDRVYVTRYKRYDYNASSSYTSNGVYTPPPVIEDGGLWAIGGVRAGQLAIVSQLVGDAQWPLAAHGSKVALYTEGGLAVYDTATPNPTLLAEQNLRGWGYTSHVLLGDQSAICSLGDWGLQTVSY